MEFTWIILHITESEYLGPNSTEKKALVLQSWEWNKKKSIVAECRWDVAQDTIWLQIGDEITVYINWKHSERQGKYYNSLRVWKITMWKKALLAAEWSVDDDLPF